MALRVSHYVRTGRFRQVGTFGVAWAVCADVEEEMRVGEKKDIYMRSQGVSSRGSRRAQAAERQRLPNHKRASSFTDAGLGGLLS